MKGFVLHCQTMDGSGCRSGITGGSAHTFLYHTGLLTFPYGTQMVLSDRYETYNSSVVWI